MKKKIAIFGSTGSIGKCLIDIIKKDKKNFEIILLSAEENYKDLFGSLPNSDVVRGYDITKDIVLRILLDNNINKTVKYGEQTYNESKFLYKKDTLGGLFNSSIYILKHFDYDIEEINQ